jgi:hypothetical protein
MPAELAHQKADKHFCVALHRKGIRLHPFKEPVAALETENYAEITPKLLVYCKKILRSDILCPHLPISLPPRNIKY